MTPEQRDKIASTRGSLWKRALWWVLGLLGLLGVVLVVWCLVRRKEPVNAAEEVVEKVKGEIAQITADAQADVAVAEGATADVVRTIRNTGLIKDPDARNRALAAALAEDY